MKSKFFHTAASIHYRHIYLPMISMDGEDFTMPNEIRIVVTSIYAKLFCQQHNVSFDLSSLPFKSFSMDQEDSLMCAFDELEILNAIKSFYSSKSLGPDGHNFLFYKNAWPIIKDEIIKFFGYFHETGIRPVGFNPSFIVLIPKVVGSSKIKD